MFPCLKILLGHSNSGVLRVTIIRKVVVSAPARRAERLSLFHPSPLFLLCGVCGVGRVNEEPTVVLMSSYSIPISALSSAI
jgi:hypothetical protein